MTRLLEHLSKHQLIFSFQFQTKLPHSKEAMNKIDTNHKSTNRLRYKKINFETVVVDRTVSRSKTE